MPAGCHCVLTYDLEDYICLRLPLCTHSFQFLCTLALQIVHSNTFNFTLLNYRICLINYALRSGFYGDLFSGAYGELQIVFTIFDGTHHGMETFQLVFD